MCVFAGLLLSCGEGADRPDDLNVPGCADNWRIVYSPEQTPFGWNPVVLQWARGHLYTIVNDERDVQLVSIPDVGGDSVVLQGRVFWNRNVWLEGDTVLFLTAGELVTLPDGSRSAPTLLGSVPAQGGASQVLTTVQDAEAPRFWTVAWALDAENAYWVDSSPSLPPTVWASPRTGGEPRLLATLDLADDFTLFNKMMPVGDHLLVYPDGYGFDVPVFSVAKAGGEARRLPTAWQNGQLLGVMNDGTVLVERTKNPGTGEPRSEEFATGRLRPGAEAVEPYWSNQPRSALAIAAWDDGAGGVYVQAWEWGPHDSIHATVWALDAAGRGRRLACDPLVKGRITAAAVGPDGVYGILQAANTFDYWSIVRIGR